MVKGKYSPSNRMGKVPIRGSLKNKSGLDLNIMDINGRWKYFVGFTSDEEGEWKIKG